MVNASQLQKESALVDNACPLWPPDSKSVYGLCRRGCPGGGDLRAPAVDQGLTLARRDGRDDRRLDGVGETEREAPILVDVFIRQFVDRLSGQRNVRPLQFKTA